MSTCEVCGRQMNIGKPWPYGDECGMPHVSVDCWKHGYARERARAEQAEKALSDYKIGASLALGDIATTQTLERLALIARAEKAERERDEARAWLADYRTMICEGDEPMTDAITRVLHDRDEWRRRAELAEAASVNARCTRCGVVGDHDTKCKWAR